MTKLFISDLHLEESRPDIAEIFLKFLCHDAMQAEALYILGDFFEAWIGDDDLSPFNLKIIRAMREATDKGLPIYFMQGNRDFLIGKKFSRATGCQLLSDEVVVDLAGSPTLLMHGDTLCTDDVAYLKFRKRSRIKLFQQIFLLFSFQRRKNFVAGMRQKSKNHTSTTPHYIMDVTQHEVERVMLKHHVQDLIHGHTHRMAVHEFELNGKPARRYVLGPWHEFGSVLVCDNHKKEFIVLR